MSISGAEPVSTNKRQTALYQAHVALGAKIVDFHGWQMPLQYQGITAEHRIVRNSCGCFDLGHMGRLRFSGPGALAFLDHRVSRPLASSKAGQVRYGLVCAEDGTVEDDVLVSRESDDAFHVVVNASNCQKLIELWQPELPDDVELVNLSDLQAMLAVQGPESAALLRGLDLDPGDLRYFRFLDLDWNGRAVRLSRTGYTGEDGFECFLAAEHAEALWNAVLDAGAQPCGLGARDTLRLEAGMPLYGNELDREHTPVEAGLLFAVGKKSGYRGAERLLDQIEHGVERRLVGLRGDGRRPPRSGYQVMRGDAVVGTVTSGTLSPTLGHPIAMAYVDSDCAEIDTTLAVDIRGRSRETVTVVTPPFYRRER